MTLSRASKRVCVACGLSIFGKTAAARYCVPCGIARRKFVERAALVAWCARNGRVLKLTSTRRFANCFICRAVDCDGHRLIKPRKEL